MSNDFASRGAQPPKPVRYSVLWNGRFSTGIVTNRSPLRGNDPWTVEHYFGTRGDAIIDGLNCEISSKLSLIRRPGLSVYNSQTFPAIDRFYDWHLFNSNTEQIKVIADTASVVYDATGPSTKTALFTKSAGAGKSFFQSVGNTLYFSDGPDQKKVVGSLLSWKANTSFDSGQFIIDPNGNIQEAVGGQTADISNIQVDNWSSGGPPFYKATLFFSPSTPLQIPDGTLLTLSGLTTIPFFNGVPEGVTVQSSLQVSFVGPFLGGLPPVTAFSPETGTATTGTGVTGGTQPAWANGINDITADGGLQWVNRGSQVEKWGITAPATAPDVTQSPAPSVYPSWVASTWYGNPFVIEVAGNSFNLTTAGTTGGAEPTWDTTPGNTTADGSAVWTCVGPTTWVAGTSYAVNVVVQNTFVYYITVSEPLPYPPYHRDTQQTVTVTRAFICTAAGVSGANPPAWTNGTGTTVTDNTVTWVCIGPGNIWPGATQLLSLDGQVVDSNGNIQAPQQIGESGSTAPTWQTALGGLTTDGTQVWANRGPYSTANTGSWIYGYSYANSLTGHVSTSSPNSTSILVALDNLAVIQGVGSSDPQVDQIWLWRTLQGGSVLFLLDQIPNPGGNQTWIYTDTTPDTSLNELIEAPIDNINDPPPTAMGAMTYHLGRIWGAVNNSVYFSTGPDVTAGNGNEAWSPSNVFVFPDSVTRLFPTTSGLIVFTVSRVYIIQGLGTSYSNFFSSPFLSEYMGLSSYDAFTVNGSIIYMYTSDNQIVTLDPSSGVSEVGFAIGNQFGTGTFTPTSTQVTWHVSGSEDKGLYVADNVGTWWRMSPTPSPETGITWSPKAQIVGGFSCVDSVETSPGNHNLLVGPATNGPILKRDYTVFSDNNSAYDSYVVFGSLILAQPGQLAYAQSITTDSVLVGTPISLAVQLDEIGPVSAGLFETLAIWEPDPPQLSPSSTIYAQRFYLSPTQEAAVCRHMQIQAKFGKDKVRNELLSLSIFGSYDQEA